MSTPKPAPLRDQITAFLAGREEATLKQIAAATTERDFPSRVTAELNKMRTDAVVECEKKKGKNELWYWLAAPARAVQDSQPAVEQNTGSSVADVSATPAAGAAVQPKPAPVAADENDDRTDKDFLSVPPPEYDPRSVAFAPKTRLAAASDENYSLLGVLADIRAAVGDPDGRLMQDELVERVHTRFKSAAAANADLDKIRDVLGQRIHIGDPGRLAAPVKCAELAASLIDILLYAQQDHLNMIAVASETLAAVADGPVDTSDMDLDELAKSVVQKLEAKDAELLEQARVVVALRDTITQRNAELRNAQALADKLEHLLQSARNEAEHLRAHTGAAKTIGYVVLPADSSGEITDYEADEAIFEPGGEAALDEAKRLAAQRVEDDECETAKICALIPVATAARRVVFEPA